MYYISRLYNFLNRLAANNNREWFRSNKSEYDELRALWEADLARLIAAMTQWDPAMASLTPKSAEYRIYRDTRFSLDKTPYKTFFSAAFSHYGKQSHRGCYYLHLDGSDEGGLYGGVWQPDSQMLRKLRQAIVDNVEEFEEIINQPDLQRYFPQWYGQRLKNVPKGFDCDHPLGEVLKLKEYGRYGHCKPEFFVDPAWPELVADRYRAVSPLVDFLNYSIDEEL